MPQKVRMQSLDSDVCSYRVDNKEVCSLEHLTIRLFKLNFRILMTLLVSFSIFWDRKENELKKCSAAHFSLICPPPSLAPYLVSAMQM